MPGKLVRYGVDSIVGSERETKGNNNNGCWLYKCSATKAWNKGGTIALSMDLPSNNFNGD